MLGAANAETCPWGSLRRHHIMAVAELLRDTGRATATINTYLSALKGVAKEAWMLKLMDVESFQHILAVRNFRGSNFSEDARCIERRSGSYFRSAKPIVAVVVRETPRCWGCY